MAKHLQVRLPDDLGAWLDSTFKHGQKQTFVVECVENLRRLMTTGTLPPPSEYSRLAALGAVNSMVERSVHPEKE